MTCRKPGVKSGLKCSGISFSFKCLGKYRRYYKIEELEACGIVNR